ncbi:hypothetical protein [Actinoplanes regularis]|uniref:Beta-phosphoglucomutase, HAD superfamily n=1 Tax=Actinoplanes regularis TaxID=52697 RepID=A0A238Z8I7_9ACTN|nr:hypothetical protein [Actinoplanes regularis]GIE85897.1 hypothetical protein Are01nite_23770 [Actinoplanes regularis]SNR79432.1 Beta-phosphoglucomutase, HAD superfamily [Actinoplanes regularis]
MDEDGVRVRPHVARAVAQARHVLLDFDGVCFAMPEMGRPWELLNGLKLRTSRLAVPTYTVPHVLAYLSAHEPELAPAVEAARSAVEWEAVLTARMATGLAELLTGSTATGRRMWVVGEYSEDAMRAGLRAHGVEQPATVVAGRQGLEYDTLGTVSVATRAVRLLGVDPSECLLVSGQTDVLRHAEDSGMALLGVVSGHDTRKWLADAAPVVSNLTRLRQALHDGPPESHRAVL